MSPIDLRHIGQIRKTFGYRGELIIEVTGRESISYENLQSVFLDIEGARIPFLIESLTIRPDQSLLVKLKKISNREEAIKLLHLQVYVPDQQVEMPDDEVAYEDLIGFLVRDARLGDIGILEEILEYPDQDILSINAAGKEVLVPLVDEFILEIDVDKKVIWLDTPDGLIDLYLSSDASPIT